MFKCVFSVVSFSPGGRCAFVRRWGWGWGGGERCARGMALWKTVLELTRLELQMLLQEGPEEKWRTSACSRDQRNSTQRCFVV